MKITYYGHSCFGVETGGKHLLFDPFVSHNELANIDINTIPADYILLSHGHQDHTADAIAIAQNTGAKIVSSYEITTWANNNGIENVHPMNTGGRWQFEFGEVRCFQAEHSSSFADGSYAGPAMGFIIKTDGKSFYYSGDTALFTDMKLIKEYYPVDLAIMCIGDNFTMGVSDAIIACDFVGVTDVIGMHYDTFGYIKIEHEAAVKQFADKGIELKLMEIGSSIDK